MFTSKNPTLNNTTIAARAAMAERVLLRRRLLPYVQKMRPRYLAGWVHKAICHKLEEFSDAVENQRSPRVMILMPPRHGKSTLASEMFPAWHLGKYPYHEIIASSYNVNLPVMFSRKVRDQLRDPYYQSLFPLTKLHPDSQSNEAWLTTEQGGYVAAGVGGGITGRGASCLLIDDPIKDAKEADSLTTRDDLWDWYGSTAYTRLSPGGGVMWIQCMTGDTPVLLPDGTEKRLDSLRAGDEVATFDNGKLSISTVAAWKSSGIDLIYRITMSSGRIVRSNGRHPFLVSDKGKLQWIRTKNLSTAHKIVAVPANGVNGKARLVLPKGVMPQLNAEGIACRTTEKRESLMDIGRRLITQFLAGPRTSSIDMALLKKNTLSSLLHRTAAALCAAGQRLLNIGGTGFVSTTATTQAESGGCYATTVTSQPDTLEPNRTPEPWQSTSDFTTDRVISVEPAGEDEVFDVQITRTENFIANGLTSHNTWWNEDDGAGRIQNAMRDDPDFDQFQIIKFPAIAEEDEYLDAAYNLYRASEGDVPSDAALVRAKGDPLHADRYTLPMLRRIEKTLTKRHWSALYQQNPTPEDGLYFTRDQFLPVVPLPRGQERARGYRYMAVDLAITDRTRSDWTVFGVIEQDPDDEFEVKDVIRGKWTDGETIIERMLDAYEKWTPDVLGIEDGAIWKTMSATFHKRARERKISPNLEILKTLGNDKGVRAVPLQILMQRGRLRWPKFAPWYDTAERELLRFLAGGNHDDIVDALAWAAQLASRRAPPPVPKEARKKSWRDRLGAIASGGRATTHLAA